MYGDKICMHNPDQLSFPNKLGTLFGVQELCQGGTLLGDTVQYKEGVSNIIITAISIIRIVMEMNIKYRK